MIHTDEMDEDRTGNRKRNKKEFSLCVYLYRGLIPGAVSRLLAFVFVFYLLFSSRIYH